MFSEWGLGGCKLYGCVCILSGEKYPQYLVDFNSKSLGPPPVAAWLS